MVAEETVVRSFKVTLMSSGLWLYASFQHSVQSVEVELNDKKMEGLEVKVKVDSFTYRRTRPPPGKPRPDIVVVLACCYDSTKVSDFFAGIMWEKENGFLSRSHRNAQKIRHHRVSSL